VRREGQRGGRQRQRERERHKERLYIEGVRYKKAKVSKTLKAKTNLSKH
jgi:hypothetical protein